MMPQREAVAHYECMSNQILSISSSAVISNAASTYQDIAASELQLVTADQPQDGQVVPLPLRDCTDQGIPAAWPYYSVQELRRRIGNQAGLERYLGLMSKAPPSSFEALVLELGLLDASQIAQVSEQSRLSSMTLAQGLIDLGLIDQATADLVNAHRVGIPCVRLHNFNVDPVALVLLDQRTATRLMAMPLCLHGKSLVVALEGLPGDAALQELRFLTDRRVVVTLAERHDILNAIHRHYESVHLPSKPGLTLVHEQPEPAAAGAMSLIEFQAATAIQWEDEVQAAPPVESDNAVVQLLTRIIDDAHAAGASDIHFESQSANLDTRLRFRKDGSLYRYGKIEARYREAVISRIKILARLDISQKREPQDGKLTHHTSTGSLELRVATIPTVNGIEDVVLRIPNEGKPVPLESLGLDPGSLTSLKRVVESPYGLVLVCGPTGAGKTTTLHSLLKHIGTDEKKIWTAEDPVEITQSGLRQVQVNPRMGWTFEKAIRSFLRADPDVIMVGEMRDPETARAVIEGSLTGHLVLSTLHTNSAPESISRMLDLGVDSFSFGDALLGILAQRLARALCPHCKQAGPLLANELRDLSEEYCQGTDLMPVETIKHWRKSYMADGGLRTFAAKGCRQCDFSGYSGRLGLHEWLIVTPAIKRLIHVKAPVSEIQKAAQSGGMMSLRQDGIVKVLQGHTDMVQVRAQCA